MSTILDKIIAHKQQEIAAQKLERPLALLEQQISKLSPPLDFAAALRSRPLAIIAELKKASPSAGTIREQFAPGELARAYEQNDAHALSVLTDTGFFQGSLNHLQQVRATVRLPVLRKDFIIDGYQILEARAYGADAVLLIATVLTSRRLTGLLDTAHTLGMAALVEVHNRDDLERALASGARIIGINNRDLATFAVDLATTEKLIPFIPDDKVIVSESGLATAADLLRVYQAGAHAVLIGTAFMRRPSPALALAQLRSAFEHALAKANP